MTYSLRPMRKEDVIQVSEIDREAFPTQYPPANYYHELQNRLAHYIVVCDDSVKAEDIPVTLPRGLSRLKITIKRLFGLPERFSGDPSLTDKQYIVGFVGIWLMADEAHITNIAVRQIYQRRGLGELLLTSIIEEAGNMNAGIMTLEVRTSNTIAQSLYTKYGFVRVGVRKGYYLDNREDGILMSTEGIASESFRARLKQLKKDLIKKIE